MRGRYREAIRAIKAVEAAHKARTAREVRRRPRLHRDAQTPLQACLHALMQAPDMVTLYGALHAASACGDEAILASAAYAFDMRAAQMRLEGEADRGQRGAAEKKGVMREPRGGMDNDLG